MSIKQDNVRVSSSGDALICDFGLSRAFYSSQTFSSFTSLKGTAQYMAYELYVSSDLHPKHSKETDVWAFGMTIYVRGRSFFTIRPSSLTSSLIPYLGDRRWKDAFPREEGGLSGLIRDCARETTNLAYR